MGIITGHGGLPYSTTPRAGKYLQGPERVRQLRAELHIDVGGLVPRENGQGCSGGWARPGQQDFQNGGSVGR